jgi:hypothetical protein
MRLKTSGSRLLLRCGAVVVAAAVSAFGAETGFVTVLGGGLRCGDRPASFACASGVRLPAPDPASGTNAVPEACAFARALARDLALSGFDMVRLPDLAVPRTGDPAAEALLAVQDEFVAACKDEGIRIWAEVLHPVCDFVPTPADSDALDDPATRDAWREAFADTNHPAASLVLAAPWDPRLEVLIQRRMRDWARAFNPRTGLRRCDDPVYALFGFSSLWWDDMDAAALPDLPPFLERELLDAWNEWLFERRGTDQALRDLFGLDPGETLASNSVAFPPPELAPNAPRTHEQRLFLHWLSVLHLSRLLTPFSSFGQASRTAPRLVRHGGPSPFLRRLSTVALFEAPAKSQSPTPSESGLPLVFDASRAPDPANGLAAAAHAAEAGADILVLPAGADPAAWASAAAAFLAARNVPASLASAAHGTAASYDFPAAAHARLDIPAPGGKPTLATFPAAGAAIAVVRAPAGETPAFPPELAASAFPRQFLVCVPFDAEPAATSEETGEDDAEPVRRPAADDGHSSVLDATVLHPSSRPGACVLHIHAPDADPGAFSVLARGRDLSRKECLRGGEPPAVLPEAGLFRIEGLSAPALLLFRPSAAVPTLFRGL